MYSVQWCQSWQNKALKTPRSMMERWETDGDEQKKNEEKIYKANKKKKEEEEPGLTWS